MTSSRYGLFIGSLLVLLVALPVLAANYESHCILDISENTSDRTMECFLTEQLALRAATNNMLDIPLIASEQTVHEKIRNYNQVVTSSFPANPPTTDDILVVVARLYDSINYSGTSLTLYTRNDINGCSIGAQHLFPQIGSMNNRAESSRGYQGCTYIQLFADENYQGAQRTCQNNCSDFGPLRNEVSSVILKNTP